MSAKRFAVRECGRGAVIGGLEGISENHGVFLLISPKSPIAELSVGQCTTVCGKGGSVYEVVRLQDEGGDKLILEVTK